MKKFFQSKGFIVSSLALLCVTILGVCWFVSRDRTGDFRPDESPPSSVTGDWSDGGTQTDGDNGADAYAPGQSTDVKEEYPKVVILVMAGRQNKRQLLICGPHLVQKIHAGTVRQVEITADHQRHFLLDGGLRFIQSGSRFHWIAPAL